MDFRTYRKLALTAEPGWGVAFFRISDCEVYNQTLYWLISSGLEIQHEYLQVKQLAGVDVIIYCMRRRTLEEFVSKMNITIFWGENECRWLLPEISNTFYRLWFSSVLFKTIV